MNENVSNSFYPGQVFLRDLPEGLLDWKKAKFKTADVFRLHLELVRNPFHDLDEQDDGHRVNENRYDDYEEETRVLKSYGKVQYGDTISRDILIPSDMPLYALHYATESLFGFQNEHLHSFELPPAKFRQITDNRGGIWLKLLGVLFRSPYMPESDEFWAEDYQSKSGSFRSWRRGKYTGKYIPLCTGEGLIHCWKDAEKISQDYPLIAIEYSKHHGEPYVCNVVRAEEDSEPGEYLLEDEPENSWGFKIFKRVIVSLEDCGTLELVQAFEELAANHLLERLSVEEVLAPHGRDLNAPIAYEEAVCDTYGKLMNMQLRKSIRDVMMGGMDFPFIQPTISPVTDVLYYYYDFGDGWKIRITGSMDACDLVEQGRVNQEQLDEAIAKVRMTYRPVCIAADGLPLVEDVGGVDGYIMFLRSINPRQELEYWGKGNAPSNGMYDSKQSSLEWAKGLGWTDKVNLSRLL